MLKKIELDKWNLNGIKIFTPKQIFFSWFFISLPSVYFFLYRNSKNLWKTNDADIFLYQWIIIFILHLIFSYIVPDNNIWIFIYYFVNLLICILLYFYFFKKWIIKEEENIFFNKNITIVILYWILFLFLELFWFILLDLLIESTNSSFIWIWIFLVINLIIFYFKMLKKLNNL